jgi:hypothetical protein
VVVVVVVVHSIQSSSLVQDVPHKVIITPGSEYGTASVLKHKFIRAPGSTGMNEMLLLPHRYPATL